jgi:hypothetical protein
MTRKQQNSERLHKRIIKLSIAGMKQSEIAEKVHRSPVYVSRALKKREEQLRLHFMDIEGAKKILQTLSGWELLLLWRTFERMKNSDAAVCLFDRAHQADVYDLLPYFRKSKTLQQKVKNTLWPPKKQ